MTQDQGTRWWSNLLQSCMKHDKGVMRFRNPMITAGKPDPNDPNASGMIKAMQEESALYGDNISMTAPKLLIRTLALTRLTPEEVKTLSSILGHASSRVDYTLEAKEQSDKMPVKDPSVNLDQVEPVTIYNMLSGIHGQEEAKKTAALMVYNHLHKRRRNIIFAGATGCGKTELFRQLSQKFDFIKIFDASGMSASGWSGSLHVRSIFESVPPEQRDHMLIVLDEFDKLLEPKYASGRRGGWDTSTAVQSNLLKLLDGDLLTFESEGSSDSFTVDCSGISVAMLGSFETLLKNREIIQKPSIGFSTATASDTVSETIITPADLIEHGNVRREIAGRIHDIVIMSPMTADDYLALIEDACASPVSIFNNQYDCRISLSDDLKARLAREAAENNLGVRYIKSSLQNMIDHHVFKDPHTKEIYLE